MRFTSLPVLEQQLVVPRPITAADIEPWFDYVTLREVCARHEAEPLPRGASPGQPGSNHGPPMKLRVGTPADVQALNAIAFAAKAHWGYSPEQLQAWRADLTISPESLTACPVCVAEEDGQPAGFVQVATNQQPWELDGLFVSPAHMGRGIGKALLAWAKDFAASRGQLELTIDADPNAEGFYKACGAVLVGSIPAPVAGNAGRIRPQLRLRTTAAPGSS